MHGRYTKRFLVAAISVVVLIAVGCRDSGSIPIGVVVPLSGNSANYGKSCQQGIDLALNEINASGGARGRQFRAIYEDDKAQAKDGLTATQKLINVDHVQVIIGGIVSAVTLAAAPVVETNHVVWLSPTSSAPAITKAGEYIFRNFPSDDLEGKVMADFINKQGIRSVAILQIQNDYGEGIAQVFSRRFTELGGKVATAEKYSQNESNFRSILTKSLATKPEAIYSVGYYTDVALLVRQARELGATVKFFATTTIEDPQFLKLGGTSVEGVIYPLASGYRSDSADDKIMAFRAAFMKAYGAEPGFVSAQCYDCMQLVKQASENAKSASGQDIQKSMAVIKGFKGVAGETSFDENGDVIKEIEIKTVRNGQFVKQQ
jgi:branched-chain amino acid transport system substrate-binding protein